MNRQPKTLKHPLLRPILCGRGQIAVATRSNWRHVGMIGKLNMYPLLAGSKVSYSTCNFTQTEMTGTSAHEECRNQYVVQKFTIFLSLLTSSNLFRTRNVTYHHYLTVCCVLFNKTSVR